MYKYHIFIVLILLFSLSSCEEEIVDFRVETNANAIVVSGEISTATGPYIIRLNQPTAYSPYDIRAFVGIPITKALVEIKDNLGNVYPLKEIFDGVYQTSTVGFKGIVGNSYSLNIKTKEGKIIVSKPSKILALTDIPNFSYKFHEADEVENMYFDVTTQIKDSETAGNNYLIKRQDYIEFLTTCPVPPPPPANPPPCYSKCWQAPLNTSPVLFDDFLINGKNIEKYITKVSLTDITQYAIDIKVYNLEKDLYEYWKRLEDQRVLNGSIFDKIPAQISGNLKCTNDASLEVLGYFGAVSVVKKRLIIDRYAHLNEVKLNKLLAYVKEKEIRYPKYTISKCWEASFVPYNLGLNIPPFTE